MLQPPSTTRLAPVMYEAPVEARKATAAATSSGVPKRRRRGLGDAALPGPPRPRRSQARGEDRPGQHGVDPDLRAVLDGELAAQRDQAALGGGVGGTAGQPDERVHRGDQHHRAASGARRSSQAGAEAEERAGEADAELAVPGLRGWSRGPARPRRRTRC